jgi:hypothetical protein
MTGWIAAAIALFIVLLVCVFGPMLGVYGDMRRQGEE